MKNYWVCMGDAVAKWDADLSALWTCPEAMLEWVRQVIAAGDQFEVMRVQESPTLGYRRDRDGSPLPLLDALFDQSRTVDLFYFTAPSVPINGVFPQSRLSGRVAYFDQHGTVQEEDVEQLGQLLARCRPDAPQTLTPVVISPVSPVLAGGPQICFSDRKKSRGMFNPKSVHVYFKTYSDIWQPWVRGMLEDDNELDTRRDNRPLAERHTPRLNAFLGRVRDLTREMGGEWRYLPDDSKFNWTGLYWDGGVRLDG